MRKFLTLAVPVMTAGAAHAGGIELTVEIPKLSVAEYHRPYVAIWIEDASGKVAANLSVWYDVDLKDSEGEKWLKDIRQWWRRTGRTLNMPIDGVSSPTKAPGVNKVTFPSDKGALATLAPGDYKLVVDATRVHDRGASDAQELGWSMAVAAGHLRALTLRHLPALREVRVSDVAPSRLEAIDVSGLDPRCAIELPAEE